MQITQKLLHLGIYFSILAINIGIQHLTSRKQVLIQTGKIYTTNLYNNSHFLKKSRKVSYFLLWPEHNLKKGHFFNLTFKIMSWDMAIICSVIVEIICDELKKCHILWQFSSNEKDRLNTVAGNFLKWQTNRHHSWALVKSLV